MVGMFLVEPRGQAESSSPPQSKASSKDRGLQEQTVTKAGQSPAKELLASVSTVGVSKALLTACSRFRDIIQNSPELLILGAGCLCTEQVADTHLWLFMLTEQGLGSRRCCRWTLKDVEGNLCSASISAFGNPPVVTSSNDGNTCYIAIRLL